MSSWDQTPSLLGPLAKDVYSMATACGSHPKVQSEMKDKWPLHLPQIAFFGLSLVIWHGFQGCGGDFWGTVCFRLGAVQDEEGRGHGLFSGL